MAVVEGTPSICCVRFLYIFLGNKMIMIKGYLMRYSDLIIEYRKGVARRPHDLSSSTHIGAKTKFTGRNVLLFIYGDRIWSCNNLFSSLSNQHTTASLLYKAAELIVPLPFPRVKKLEDSVTSSPARILVPCMDHVETPVTYFYYLVFSDNMDHVETPATATLEVMLKRLHQLLTHC